MPCSARLSASKLAVELGIEAAVLHRADIRYHGHAVALQQCDERLQCVAWSRLDGQ